MASPAQREPPALAESVRAVLADLDADPKLGGKGLSEAFARIAHLRGKERGRDAAPFDRSVDVLISRLRRKIEEDPKEPSIIKTVRGGGYVLASGVDAQ